ncbi:MAG: FtsX-like permease family protein [Kiritimatiellae bacterium]|nr:FtsX-like permease family protein [Kiritimatiellia bacterium]
MNVLSLVWMELRHRKLSFALSATAVAVAAGVTVGAAAFLNAYDVRTEQLLAAKRADLDRQADALKDDMRKATLKLGFNLLVLPRDQPLKDYYAEDYAAKSMPEAYVERLAQSGVVTIRHFLPILQKKTTWPEAHRTIVLIGTRGEVPNPALDKKKPLVQPVPAGAMVLGHELHTTLGLKPGDTTTLLGQAFRVDTCHEERGTQDDISVWIPLADAQRLLGQPGRINAILAIECLCAAAEALPRVRAEIERVLPDTQAVEFGTRVLARAEARFSVIAEAERLLAREAAARQRLRGEREAFASVAVPLIMAACAVWVGLLAWRNVRARLSEIGILRAMGVRSARILALFLAKAAAVGCVGGAAGVLAAVALATRMAAAISGTEGLSVRGVAPAGWVVAALLGAGALAVLATWLPAVLATRLDPAKMLRET